MTSERLGEMFKGDPADMCAGKFPLVLMGGRADLSSVSRWGGRTPIGASGNLFIISGLSNNRTRLKGLGVAQTQMRKFSFLIPEDKILKTDTKKSMLYGCHDILFFVEKLVNLLTVSRFEKTKFLRSAVHGFQN